MLYAQEIIAKIEALNTDSFVKFYVYSALLRMMTDTPDKRHDQRSFEALLPAYSLIPGITGDCLLNLGNPEPDFYQLITTYANQVKFLAPGHRSSDVLCILNEMLSHLKLIPLESMRQSSAAYGAIAFERCQQHIENYLESAIELNHARKMLFYKFLGTACILLILMQITWNAPILLAFAANGIAIALAYGFMCHTQYDLSHKKSNYDLYATILKDHKKTYTLETMYDRFFICSIITPVDQATNYIKDGMPISEENISIFGY